MAQPARGQSTARARRDGQTVQPLIWSRHAAFATIAPVVKGADASRDGTLFHGDNLDVLERISTSSVDLVYLDPPFNSKRAHCLFKPMTGGDAHTQVKAFDDTWAWNERVAAEHAQLVGGGLPAETAEALAALHRIIGENAMMAYLVMMAPRLVQLRRVLEPTGSLYLHCDPTASHYLKIFLDAVFGPQQFRNEIIWKRTSAHSDASRYGNAHDVILYYVASARATWNETFQPYEDRYTEQYYRYEDDDGRRFMSDNLSASGLSGGGYTYEWHGHTKLWRCPIATMRRLEAEGRIFYTRNGVARRKRYLDEAKGQPVQDVWTDIEPLRSWHEERTGYPTQKPLALLERSSGRHSQVLGLAITSSPTRLTIPFTPEAASSRTPYSTQASRAESSS